MSKNYQDHPPLDRVHLAAGLGGNKAVSGPERPAYVPPQIVDLTTAQRVKICRSNNCVAPVASSGDSS